MMRIDRERDGKRGRGVTLWLARVKGRDKEGQRVERRGKEGDKQRNKKRGFRVNLFGKPSRSKHNKIYITQSSINMLTPL